MLPLSEINRKIDSQFALSIGFEFGREPDNGSNSIYSIALLTSFEHWSVIVSQIPYSMWGTQTVAKQGSIARTLVGVVDACGLVY